MMRDEDGGTLQGKPLTRKELVRYFSQVLHLAEAQTRSLFALLAEIAIEETRAKGVFVLPGIGRLVTSKRKLRLGRSPQTGSAINSYLSDFLGPIAGQTAAVIHP